MDRYCFSLQEKTQAEEPCSVARTERKLTSSISRDWQTYRKCVFTTLSATMSSVAKMPQAGESTPNCRSHAYQITVSMTPTRKVRKTTTIISSCSSCPSEIWREFWVKNVYRKSIDRSLYKAHRSIDIEVRPRRVSGKSIDPRLYKAHRS